MLQYPVILAIVIVVLIVLSIVSYFVTGTIFSFFIILLIAGMIVFLLNTFGVLKFGETTDPKTKKKQFDVQFIETNPAPSATKKVIPAIVENKEVFHVGTGEYTYEEAPAVCAAWDAELATYDQIQDAFAKGAEWCTYGWSQGGMALFPTQKSTWEAIQKEPNRTVCGRPGINGGYMDPKLKLGVNCYGVKLNTIPGIILPQPVPGSATSTGKFRELVNKMMNSKGILDIAPFNRQEWKEEKTLPFKL